MSSKRKILWAVITYLAVLAVLVIIAILIARADQERLPEGSEAISHLLGGDVTEQRQQGELIPDWAPRLGPDNAKVTIVEFGDFQCPFCKASVQPLKQVLKEYPNDVQLVFRQFPLTSIHPLAESLAHASLCAHEQGAFWPFHDRLFTYQDGLSISDLDEHAQAVGMDVAAFQSCQGSGKYKDEVQKDFSEAVARGANGTPAFVINGQLVQGTFNFETWRQIIETFLRNE